MKAGERYKVKSTPWRRRHPLAVHNVEGFMHPDCYADAGEVAEVVERRWQWTNAFGETGESSGLWLEWSRGRQLACDSADPEDFVKVPLRHP